MLSKVIEGTQFTKDVQKAASIFFGDESEASCIRLVERYFVESEQKFTITHKGTNPPLSWIKGNYMLLGSRAQEVDAYPTRQARVMLLGGCPTTVGAPMSSSLYELFSDLLMTAEIPDWRSWYFTWLVKYYADFHATAGIPTQWVKTCRPWLDVELATVRPEWVICFGTPTLRAITGEKHTYTDSLCEVIETEYQFPNGEALPLKVLAAPPLARMENVADSCENCNKALQQFQFLQGLTEQYNKTDITIRHQIIRDPVALAHEVSRVQAMAKANPRRRIIAVDMEWEGDYPAQPGAHLLTAQFSSIPGEATVVVLHDENGENPERKGLVTQLKRLLLPSEDWKPRVGGHFLRADLPWLMALGIEDKKTGVSVKDSYAAPSKQKECRAEGGWDTSLAYHAYSEEDSYGLKYLAVRECGLHHWERELYDFIDKYREEHNMKKADLHGYGCVPDAILHPYAAWDADATRRLIDLCFFGTKDRAALLDRDRNGQSCWQPYWLAHSASLGFLEMEETGLLLDRARFRALSDNVFEASDILLNAFRSKVNWPDFKPSSTTHKRGVLFGKEFSKGYSEKLGEYYAMPDTAVSLGLDPEYTTKNKQAWDSLEVDELETNSASTDKNVMKLLAQKNPDAALLRDICVLQRNLQIPLSTPTVIEDNKGYHRLYPNGLYPRTREDGKIHTRMSQLKVTGRASSSDPPLQNIGKSVEASLMRILGTEKDGEESGDYLDLLGRPMYLYPLRSILRADKDCVLICADFTGAELAVLAWVSQDPNMIEHVRRNALPEDSADYYDIHSNIAVAAFKLDCEPTKKGLSGIGKKHLRVAAKAVVFGIAYGRGAKAIALQCNADGIPLTQEEAQGLIQSFFDTYPCVKRYLDDCKQQVAERGYVTTLFGRYRRFAPIVNSKDNSVLAKQQREGCNAPIQGTVADAVNITIRNLLWYRKLHPELRFKIALQIHDELALLVHKDDAAIMKNKVLPYCMIQNVSVPVMTQHGLQKYHFGIGADMYVHWGEPITEEIAQRELGVSLAYLTGEN